MSIVFCFYVIISLFMAVSETAATAKTRLVKLTEAVALLGILLIPLVHTSQIFDSFLAPKALALWLFGPFLLLLYSLVLLLSKKETLSLPFLVVIIYTLWLIPGWLFSVFPPVSFYGSRWNYTGLISHLSALGFFIGGYLLAKNEHLFLFLRTVLILAWFYPLSPLFSGCAQKKPL